jgi:hypothetical protein
MTVRGAKPEAGLSMSRTECRGLTPPPFFTYTQLNWTAFDHRLRQQHVGDAGAHAVLKERGLGRLQALQQPALLEPRSEEVQKLHTECVICWRLRAPCSCCGWTFLRSRAAG